MKNLKNATVNRNVFVKRCPQGPKLKQNRTEIELQIKVMTNVYSCFRICTNLVVSAQEKKIQICNSNLIIRQILLVFEAGYDMKNNTGRGIEVSLELNIHTSSLLFCTFTSKAVL